MNQQNFETWHRANLVKFATECLARLELEQAANEQLRKDLSDAMKIARREFIGHN